MNVCYKHATSIKEYSYGFSIIIPDDCVILPFHLAIVQYPLIVLHHSNRWMCNAHGRFHSIPPDGCDTRRRPCTLPPRDCLIPVGGVAPVNQVIVQRPLVVLHNSSDCRWWSCNSPPGDDAIVITTGGPDIEYWFIQLILITPKISKADALETQTQIKVIQPK